jgi:hypothetical protein
MTIMKKLSLIFLVFISVCFELNAQNTSDALRNSQVFYSGTARFMSMGGAFTALGGDLSSLSQNPAGLGVFRSSEITLSPQLYHFKSLSKFNGTWTKDYLYDFNLSQAGIVANIIRNDAGSGLVTLNFGYSFNRTSNLNESILVEGQSSNSSLLDYWAEKSEGYYRDQLSSKVPEAFLAYDTYLLDTLPGSNTSYGTVFSNYGDNPPSVYGQTISRMISNEGSTAEHAFSIGGNYANKLMFGVTLGINHLSYSRKYEHMESTKADLASRFTDFNYTFHYSNTGTGYGIKIGAIYKPVEALRLGFAFHSPIFYRINAVLDDNISSYFSYSAVPYESSNDPLRYNYALTTPFRALAGAALQIKKLALLSLDYEFVDYSTAKFSETGDNFDYTAKNKDIKKDLKSVSNIRMGAEFRLNKLYLRGGYGLYGKAWKEGIINEDLLYHSISFGLGLREQNISVDLGYSTIINSERYTLYDANIETVVSNMDLKRNMFTVSVGYKFGY